MAKTYLEREISRLRMHYKYNMAELKKELNIKRYGGYFEFVINQSRYFKKELESEMKKMKIPLTLTAFQKKTDKEAEKIRVNINKMLKKFKQPGI